MTSHKILRAGIFIMAFLVGLLREGIAHGANASTPAYNTASDPAFGEIHPC
jgi:hypothetical protein